MQDQSQEMAARAQEYQQAVLDYEALEHQIMKFLAVHAGGTRNLSDEQFLEYRDLADRRDLAYNRMKTLEKGLLDD